MKHLTYKKYRGLIEYSSEDDLLWGKILGIDDVVTYDGNSLEEIKTNFENAVNEYLEFCTEVGKTPEKEYKGEFVVRIDKPLHRKAVIIAAAEKISLNKLVERAIIKETENQ